MNGELVNELRVTFQSGKTKSIEWRRGQLKAMKNLVADNMKALGDALYQDLHRCKFEAIGCEINALSVEIDHVLKNIDKWYDEQSTHYVILYQV
jgi:aldehyde dehydrogenase (NAD+)